MYFRPNSQFEFTEGWAFTFRLFVSAFSYSFLFVLTCSYLFVLTCSYLFVLTCSYLFVLTCSYLYTCNYIGIKSIPTLDHTVFSKAENKQQ